MFVYLQCYSECSLYIFCSYSSSSSSSSYSSSGSSHSSNCSSSSSPFYLLRFCLRVTEVARFTSSYYK